MGRDPGDRLTGMPAPDLGLWGRTHRCLGHPWVGRNGLVQLSPRLSHCSGMERKLRPLPTLDPLRNKTQQHGTSGVRLPGGAAHRGAESELRTWKGGTAAPGGAEGGAHHTVHADGHPGAQPLVGTVAGEQLVFLQFREVECHGLFSVGTWRSRWASDGPRETSCPRPVCLS